MRMWMKFIPVLSTAAVHHLSTAQVSVWRGFSGLIHRFDLA